MNENQPPPYDNSGAGRPDPYAQNPYAQQPGGIPAYPGAGQSDMSAYGEQPQSGGMPPLANWGYRALGYLVDAAIIGIPYAIVRFAVSGGAGALLAGAVALLCTLGFAYMEGTTGQSPGKRVVGTRLLREADGQVLGFGLAFGRRLLHILDVLPCYLGFLWPAWDAKKQTFADKLVHTVVIKP